MACVNPLLPTEAIEKGAGNEVSQGTSMRILVAKFREKQVKMCMEVVRREDVICSQVRGMRALSLFKTDRPAIFAATAKLIFVNSSGSEPSLSAPGRACSHLTASTQPPSNSKVTPSDAFPSAASSISQTACAVFMRGFE